MASIAGTYSGGMAASGGDSGANDLRQAIPIAGINTRAGGMGLISGRKAFQNPMDEGIALLNAIRDMYQSGDVPVS